MEISFFALAQAQLRPNSHLLPLANFKFLYFPHDLCSAYPNFLGELTDNAKVWHRECNVSFCSLGQENELHQKQTKQRAKRDLSCRKDSHHY